MEHWINYRWREGLDKYNAEVKHVDDDRIVEDLNNSVAIVADILGNYSFRNSNLMNLKFQDRR